MTHSRTTMILAPMLALAACGDPKVASNANFKHALADHYANHCIFIAPSVATATYPVSIDTGSDTTRFDALVSAGLLTASDSSAEHPGTLGIGTVHTDTRTYSLTEAGKTAYHAGGAASGFCAGHYDVTSIDGFTQPTASNGRTVSDVSFTLSPAMAGWVANPAVQQRYGQALAAIHGAKDHTTMVLMDHGWEVASDAPS